MLPSLMKTAPPAATSNRVRHARAQDQINRAQSRAQWPAPSHWIIAHPTSG